MKSEKVKQLNRVSKMTSQSRLGKRMKAEGVEPRSIKTRQLTQKRVKADPERDKSKSPKPKGQSSGSEQEQDEDEFNPDDNKSELSVSSNLKKMTINCDTS